MGNLYSQPYRIDYITWAKKIAKLSIRYSNLVGYVIDDFWENVRENTLLTPTYINKMVTAGKVINPNLKFYPLTYSNEVFNPYTMNISTLFDGMVVAFAEDSLKIAKNNSLMNSSLHSKAVMSITPITTIVNLGTALKGRNSALLSLGIYKASRVWNYATNIAFLDLLPHGINLNTDFGSGVWVVSSKGPITTKTVSVNKIENYL